MRIYFVNPTLVRLANEDGDPVVEPPGGAHWPDSFSRTFYFTLQAHKNANTH